MPNSKRRLSKILWQYQGSQASLASPPAVSEQYWILGDGRRIKWPLLSSKPQGVRISEQVWHPLHWPLLPSLSSLPASLQESPIPGKVPARRNYNLQEEVSPLGADLLRKKAPSYQKKV